jgi:hypothetical protein
VGLKLCKMESDIVVGFFIVESVLPEGVAECDGISRLK